MFYVSMLLNRYEPPTLFPNSPYCNRKLSSGCNDLIQKRKQQNGRYATPGNASPETRAEEGAVARIPDHPIELNTNRLHPEPLQIWVKEVVSSCITMAHLITYRRYARLPETVERQTTDAWNINYDGSSAARLPGRGYHLWCHSYRRGGTVTVHTAKRPWSVRKCFTGG